MSHSTLPLVTAGNDAYSNLMQPAGALRIVTRELNYLTSAKFEILDLTDMVRSIVSDSGIRNGLIHVQSLHTTTALFLNERQEALLWDYQALLRLLVDERNGWRHNDPRYSDCDRHNAAAHLRGLILGHSLSLQVQEGRPLLGRWQAILFVELDGPRPRHLAAQVMGV